MNLFFKRVAVLAFVFLTSGEVCANDDTSAPVVEEVETVEVVDAVEVVEETNLPSATTSNEPSALNEEETVSMSLAQLAGRLHPAFVHLPLGLLIGLLLLEIVNVKNKEPHGGSLFWAAAVSSYFPAAMSGFLRASEIAAMGGQIAPESHRNWMLISFGFLAVGLALRFFAPKNDSIFLRFSRIGLIGTATIVAFAGAHLGGKLVYGSTFLPF